MSLFHKFQVGDFVKFEPIGYGWINIRWPNSPTTLAGLPDEMIGKILRQTDGEDEMWDVAIHFNGHVYYTCRGERGLEPCPDGEAMIHMLEL